MLEAAGESVWLRDLATNEISVTPGLWSALGYPEHTIPETLEDALQYFHPEDAGPLLDGLDVYLAGEVDAYRSQARIRSTDGEWRWLRLSGGTILADEAGKPLIVGGLISDITDCLKREHKRELAAKKLSEISSREADVLKGLTSGMTSKEIARSLELSPRTVEFYRGRLMQKLEVTSLPELIHLCLTAEWMSSAAQERESTGERGQRRIRRVEQI